MELVIDTNIVFSAIVRNSVARLLAKGIHFEILDKSA